MRYLTACFASLSFGLTACGNAELDVIDPDLPAQSAAALGGPKSCALDVFAPPAPDAFMTAFSMSEAGLIVGYSGSGPGDPLAVPVSIDVDTGAVTVLPTPQRRNGLGWGASGLGQVFGEYDYQPHAWVNGALTPLPKVPGWWSGSAHSGNGDGLVVGTFGDYDDPWGSTPGPRPMAWVGATFTPVALKVFSDQKPIGSVAGIDGHGRIFGSLGTVNGVVRWNEPTATPQVLPGVPGADGHEARACNSRGAVVGRAVFSANYSSAAFLLRANGAAVQLPYLPGHTTDWAEAIDVDEAERAVGTGSAADGKDHAVLWQRGAALDLNDCLITRPPNVSRLSSAVGIDGRGRIAVTVELTSGQSTVGVLRPAR